MAAPVSLSASPFRGLAPFDAAAAPLFFGRDAEIAVLVEALSAPGVRAVAVTGEIGAGKTSLLHAGLLPALARAGVAALIVDATQALDQELWRAATRVPVDPPSARESPADYVARIAATSPGGAALIVDHVEVLGVLPPHETRREALLDLLARTAATGGRLRFVYCVDISASSQLDDLVRAGAAPPAPGRGVHVMGLHRAAVAQIVERTVVQTGTMLEAGLADAIAADLCSDGPCPPADLQLVARAVLDQRLTSIRRYERSGGAAPLIQAFFERVIDEAGRGPARRLLLTIAELGDVSADEITPRLRLGRHKVDHAFATFVARGLIEKLPSDAGDRFRLVHPCLAPRVRQHAALEIVHARAVRLSLRRKQIAGGRLSLRELWHARRHLLGVLNDAERAILRRSLHRALFQIALVALALGGLFTAVAIDARASFSLAYDPAPTPGARVVVRRGRPSLAALSYLPGVPSASEVFADTGFTPNAIARDLTRRIADGRASGTLERDASATPPWLRMVIDGLEPVRRGVALILLGDQSGIVSLKQAFADPATRREVLRALALIGRGSAGEDEILAAALADSSPEIRRQAVEVAAAVARRMNGDLHGTALRSALGDRSADVRRAVLRACASLPPSLAASVLQVALADRDGAFRRLAEQAALDLADRSVQAAVDATSVVLGSGDVAIRRAGLALLDRLVAKAPSEASRALLGIVQDENVPEDARVAVLGFLRAARIDPEPLRAALQKAVLREASPRLRAAALPLYARLLDPVDAVRIATEETRGGPASRAAGAAVWGAVAEKDPAAAAQALKAMSYDAAPAVREEAARAYGYLGADGLDLIRRCLRDPNMAVAEAALEAAVIAAGRQTYTVVELLLAAFKTGRPALRRAIIDVTGRVGRDRPTLVLPILARALKESDPLGRVSAVKTLCVLGEKTPGPVAPYLHAAAGDEHRDVREAVAGCVDRFGVADPRNASRIATRLATALEPEVREAAAASLVHLADAAGDTALATLVTMLGDSAHGPRLAAARGIAIYGRGHKIPPRRAAEIERALSAMLARPDTAERKAALEAAVALRALAPVEQAFSEGDEALRLEAVRAAATVDGGLRLLRAAVDDAAATVRAEATRRLARTSGQTATDVLPIFETMLASSDAETRKAGIVALGDLTDAGDAPTSLLAGALDQSSEGVRAAAIASLGKIAAQDSLGAKSLLERGLADPAYDVRLAAARGLGVVWARDRSADDNARDLVGAEADSARRLVALTALVHQMDDDGKREAARAALDRVADGDAPLARLYARAGRAFTGQGADAILAFIDKLLGG